MFSKYSFLNIKRKEPEIIPTDIEAFDKCLGGGLLLGRVTELVGEPDSGKTRLLFDMLEKLSNKDIIIAYISTTGKSLDYLLNMNINRENTVLLVSNDETVILDFIKDTIKCVDIFMIDNIPNILTSNEHGNFDLNEYQNVPRLLSELNTIIYGEKSSILAINHLIYKNGEYVPRWQNMFRKYCCVRTQLNKYNASFIDLMLLSHKIKPELVGGEYHELRMG